eukprot:276527_1
MNGFVRPQLESITAMINGFTRQFKKFVPEEAIQRYENGKDKEQCQIDTEHFEMHDDHNVNNCDMHLESNNFENDNTNNNNNNNNIDNNDMHDKEETRKSKRKRKKHLHESNENEPKPKRR